MKEKDSEFEKMFFIGMDLVVAVLTAVTSGVGIYCIYVFLNGTETATKGGVNALFLTAAISVWMTITILSYYRMKYPENEE